MSADIQKFQLSLAKARASNLSSVGEDGVISMAAALQTGHSKTTQYDQNEYATDNWIYFKAYNVLKKHPKWSFMRLPSMAPKTPSIVQIPG